MASTAEVKAGALYTNVWKGEELCTALKEMGHPQLPISITTDNTTTKGIVNDTVKQRRSHMVVMQFYWLKDRYQQGHFQVYWRPQDESSGDYHTRHHPVEHYKDMCTHSLTNNLVRALHA
eukprot:15338565-Ditylum_brightwellii.AAC.1